jgi:hypothetical protein
MKTWKDFINQKFEESNTSVGDDKGLGDISSNLRGEDPMSSMYRLINRAWENHRGETKKFFKSLSKKDPEIQSELSKLMDNVPLNSTGMNSDDDEVAVPHADSGGDQNSDPE